MVLHTPWRTPLTQEEDDELFMLGLEGDTEDAPWMVMGDLQFWSASAFAHSLRIYVHEQGLPWYVASMLPINYRLTDTGRKRTLAPDTFVAFVPEHARTSYDVKAEGGFPAFVLEVVSPSSVARDEEEKPRAYNLLGAREYALFTPHEGAASTRAGHRRDATGQLEPWPLDEQSRLWSDVLGLYLVVRGALLQAQTPDGRLADPGRNRGGPLTGRGRNPTRGRGGCSFASGIGALSKPGGMTVCGTSSSAVARR